MMARMIFVNLPVTDLSRATAFYDAIDFINNPYFTDYTAACMVLTEAINVPGVEATEKSEAYWWLA